MKLLTWSRIVFAIILLVAAGIGISGLWILISPASDSRKIGSHGQDLPVKAQPVAVQRTVAPVIAGNEFDPTKPRTLVIRALDKITLRMREYELGMDQQVRFGMLTITARTCQATPPELPPENAAFLQIDEGRPGQKPRRIFSGWMFGSSPAVNGLENGNYDVWVVQCKMSFADRGPDTIEVTAVSAEEKRGTGKSLEGALPPEGATVRRRPRIKEGAQSEDTGSESVPVPEPAPAATPATEPPLQ